MLPSHASYKAACEAGIISGMRRERVTKPRKEGGREGGGRKGRKEGRKANDFHLQIYRTSRANQEQMEGHY